MYTNMRANHKFAFTLSPEDQAMAEKLQSLLDKHAEYVASLPPYKREKAAKLRPTIAQWISGGYFSRELGPPKGGALIVTVGNSSNRLTKHTKLRTSLGLLNSAIRHGFGKLNDIV